MLFFWRSSKLRVSDIGLYCSVLDSISYALYIHTVQTKEILIQTPLLWRLSLHDWQLGTASRMLSSWMLQCNAEDHIPLLNSE